MPKQASEYPSEIAQERDIQGMRPAKLMAPIFAKSDPAHVRMSREMLRAGVIGLMLQDVAWLRAYPQTPPLYRAGVVYRPEKNQRDTSGRLIQYGEEWQTIPWILFRGYGDCEDLGAWRSAELNARGVRALPHIKIRRLPNGFWRAHVVVEWPSGRIEDPSAKLGMYAYANR